jgi:hypothetical protein
MKKTLLLLSLSAISANAAITIGGASITNAKASDGTTNIPTGSLVLLIVDTAGDGFFNFGASPAAASKFTSTADPLVLSGAAGLTASSTFGGEYVLGRVSSGAGSVSSILTNVSVSSYLNKSFALVWFQGLTASGTETVAAAGTKWGVARGTDWVFPSADSGTFTSSSSDANGATSFYQVNQTTPAAGSDAFRSVTGNQGAAIFTVAAPVPEASTALLGAIGALGLLRRRRN